MSLVKSLSAIITGASSGIGKATAQEFAKAKIDLALVSRSLDKLAKVKEALSTEGVRVKTYSIDLAKIGQVKPNIAKIVEDFGEIDILVNNAGMGYTNSLAETPLTDWQQVIDLNLTSAFQCTQAILPHMRSRQTGMIINVASIAATNAFPGWGAYSVSKAGLVAFSKTLALEERANGIRVACLSPGAVNTPIWDTDTVKADFDRTAMLTPEIVAQSILHIAMMPKQAVVEDMTIMPSGGAL
ncbi:MAG: SDR family oxidoreductase [Cyanobacteria bacterium J083]|nr:MAG: SDR family oxidoreductase [Cyanobacteria bacterium J083]